MKNLRKNILGLKRRKTSSFADLQRAAGHVVTETDRYQTRLEAYFGAQFVAECQARRRGFISRAN